MSEKINDGGSAFPASPVTRIKDVRINGIPCCDTYEKVPQDGMSLRDWFAGMVLSARTIKWGDSIQEHAEIAYRLADAMLAERMMSEKRIKNIKIGVAAWIEQPDGRPDKFEAVENGIYHFPCDSCRHAGTRDREFCRGCVHYVL